MATHVLLSFNVVHVNIISYDADLELWLDENDCCYHPELDRHIYLFLISKWPHGQGEQSAQSTFLNLS